MKFIRTLETSHRATSRLDQAEIDILRSLEMDWRNLTAREGGTGRFDPAQLETALPHSFMLERTAPGSVRLRVAGQRLHQLLKMDPRGMLFTAFFNAGARDTIMRLTETAFDQPAIVGIPLTASRGLGRKALRAEALLLPMQDADGLLTKVMGALVVSGDIGARGLRFDLAKDQPVRCDGIRRPMVERRRYRDMPADPPPARPSLHPQPKVTPLTTKKPEQPLKPLPTPAPKPRRPALRLVVDNT